MLPLQPHSPSASPAPGYHSCIAITTASESPLWLQHQPSAAPTAVLLYLPRCPSPPRILLSSSPPLVVALPPRLLSSSSPPLLVSSPRRLLPSLSPPLVVSSLPCLLPSSSPSLVASSSRCLVVSSSPPRLLATLPQPSRRLTHMHRSPLAAPPPPGLSSTTLAAQPFACPIRIAAPWLLHSFSLRAAHSPLSAMTAAPRCTTHIVAPLAALCSPA